PALAIRSRVRRFIELLHLWGLPPGFVTSCSDAPFTVSSAAGRAQGTSSSGPGPSAHLDARRPAVAAADGPDVASPSVQRGSKGPPGAGPPTLTAAPPHG